MAKNSNVVPFPYPKHNFQVRCYTEGPAKHLVLTVMARWYI